MDITQALALFAFAAILAVLYTFPHLTYIATTKIANIITTTKINLRKKTSTANTTTNPNR